MIKFYLGKPFYRVKHPLGIALVALIFCVIAFLDRQSTNNRVREFQLASQQAEANQQRLAQEYIGFTIFKNYGTLNQTSEQDLTDISHAIGNFMLLVKGDNPLPLGANEDIANALRGKNRTKLQFLPPDAPCFNVAGQLVDRWKTPLFFHANGRDKLDIRSAGPDLKLWTADDIHRHYDGQFIRGEALNSPSLFDATQDYRPEPR